MAFTPARADFEPLVTAYLQCKGGRMPSYVEAMTSSFNPPTPSECENLQNNPETAGARGLGSSFVLSMLSLVAFVKSVE